MGIYNKFRKKISAALLLLIIFVFISIFLGRYRLNVQEVLQLLGDALKGTADTLSAEYATLFNIRLPRLIAVLLVGAALSVSGAVYQSLFNNPMVSTDILGASQAAGFGAVIAIMAGLGTWEITFSSFGMSVLGVSVTYFLSTRFSASRILSLILSGILVTSLFSSGISYMKLVADSQNVLPEITYWLMGSFASIRRPDLIYLVPLIVIPLVIILCMRWRINLFTLSEDEAKSIGVNIGMMRAISVVCVSIMTAACVSVTGIIGWVGLVVPHMARSIVGDDNRFVIPMSMLVGAMFLLVADTIARTISSLEIPISIVTSFIGVPFFIFLLVRRGDRGDRD